VRSLKHSRLWLGIGWGLVALVVYFSLIPNPPRLDFRQGDKLQHVCAYFGLMLWFGQIYLRRLPLALSLLALGLSMEILQGFTDYREASALDMLANAVGVGLGWLAARRWPGLLARIEAL
jgi:VanZ family protein